jgi:hypothetical protein
MSISRQKQHFMIVRLLNNIATRLVLENWRVFFLDIMMYKIEYSDTIINKDISIQVNSATYSRIMVWRNKTTTFTYMVNR